MLSCIMLLFNSWNACVYVKAERLYTSFGIENITRTVQCNNTISNQQLESEREGDIQPLYHQPTYAHCTLSN